MAWSATPWLVAALARAGGDAPFDRDPTRAWWRDVLGLGLLTALAAAAVPVAVFAPIVLAVALVLGGLVAGRFAGAGRMLATAALATLVAVVLHLPWSLSALLPDATWASFGGAGVVRAGADGRPSCCASSSGRSAARVVGYAFAVAALLPLLIGRSWRVSWAVRAWALAIVGWGLAVAAGSDGFAVTLGPPELLLAPAACGLALAAALGVVAFEVDLPGYRFGWRQVVGFAAACGRRARVRPCRGRRRSTAGGTRRPVASPTCSASSTPSRRPRGRSARCGSATRRCCRSAAGSSTTAWPGR